MTIITKRKSFDAAHWLPNHYGKCHNLHGHTYIVECSVAGNRLDTPGHSSNGMVLDFAVLKEAMNSIIILWDHHVLTPYTHDQLVQLFKNNKKQLEQFGLRHARCVPIGEDTTAENLAHIFAEHIYDALQGRKIAFDFVRILLHETPDSWAIAEIPQRGE